MTRFVDWVPTLPAADPLTGDEVIPIVQDGQTRRYSLGTSGGVREDLVNRKGVVFFNAKTSNALPYYIGYGVADPLFKTMLPGPVALEPYASTSNWTDSDVAHPYPFVMDDGTVRLYFSGYNGTVWGGMGLMVSDLSGDLRDFRTFDGDDGRVFGPATGWETGNASGLLVMWPFYDEFASDPDRRWKMTYGAGDPLSVGFAYSADGITWTRQGSGPIISPTANTWESIETVGAMLFRDPNKPSRLYTTYSARGSIDARYRHGLAWSDDDGLTWSRKSTPILEPRIVTTALGANVTGGYTTDTVTVADSSAFVVGESVYIFDDNGDEFLKIKAIPNSTTLVFDTDIFRSYTTADNGEVRSWMWGSVSPTDIYWDGKQFRVIGTAVNAVPGELREIMVTMTWEDIETTNIQLHPEMGAPNQFNHRDGISFENPVRLKPNRWSDLVNSDPPVKALAWRSTNQSIPNDTNTAIVFDESYYDDHKLWAGFKSEPTIMYALREGWYRLQGRVAFAGNSTGIRAAKLRLNGNYQIADSVDQDPLVVDCLLAPSAEIYMQKGDYVELVVFQNSGGALNVVTSDPTLQNPTLTMTLIGEGRQGTK
jgi:hypothetical protein